MLPAAQAQEQYAMQDYLSLSIEELSNIKITSVSKQEESLSNAAASIYVITQDDIRGSGATTIPEALRLAPNLHVSRVSGGHYAISARGFNNAIGNKLLVLIDGRTVYSPVFSGVFWDQQDIMLEDVERIEVISGPGGALWGSNAVNGVINIITRSTGDTQGFLATVGGGNLERGAGIRYGGTIGDHGHYRVYGKGMESDHTERTDGSAVNDTFTRAQVGFRIDLSNDKRQITLQGDFYDGELGGEDTPEDDKLHFYGGNLLGRYTRQFENDSEFAIQSYFDRAVRDNDNLLGIGKDEMTIFDLEAQYVLPILGNNRVLIGGGYRKAEDRVENNPDAPPLVPQILYLPENKDLRWRNFFIQDEITLPGALALTVGGKWEENIYTGTEFLPNLRLTWQPQSDQLLWTSLSRAVRAPARVDKDFHLRASVPEIFQILLNLPPVISFINGGPDFESEISDVAEIGWRAQAGESFSYSITAFYAEHDKQRSGERDPDDTTGFTFLVSNTIEGTSKGLEAWASYQVSDWWRVNGGFVELRQELRNEPGSTDPAGPRALGNDPEHISMLRSIFDFNKNHQLQVKARHTGKLPEPEVQSFTAVDIHYGWRLSGNFELSLLLQNLFDTGHVEFYGESDGIPLPVEYGRGAFLKLVGTY
jgi:iron complex outermembrane receptor protein